MANKPRCKACNHLKGPRRTGRFANIDQKKGEQPRTKKAGCTCACHQVDTDVPTKTEKNRRKGRVKT